MRIILDKNYSQAPTLIDSCSDPRSQSGGLGLPWSRSELEKEPVVTAFVLRPHTRGLCIELNVQLRKKYKTMRDLFRGL